MNPSQSLTQASSTTLSLGDPGELNFLRKFTGNYYRFLGWFVVASNLITIATVYWTGYLHIDLSFFFWLWLGSCLKKGNPAARKWAIAIFLIVVALLILGFLMPEAKAKFGDYKFDKSHPVYFAIVGLIGTIFAVPGVMLLGKRGRVAFDHKRTANL
ncbi:MAG: hypothetical protein V4727_10090 [Verrucomicrobiota bacterium]